MQLFVKTLRTAPKHKWPVVYHACQAGARELCGRRVFLYCHISIRVNVPELGAARGDDQCPWRVDDGHPTVDKLDTEIQRAEQTTAGGTTLDDNGTVYTVFHV